MCSHLHHCAEPGHKGPQLLLHAAQVLQVLQGEVPICKLGHLPLRLPKRNRIHRLWLWPLNKSSFLGKFLSNADICRSLPTAENHGIVSLVSLQPITLPLQQELLGHCSRSYSAQKSSRTISGGNTMGFKFPSVARKQAIGRV